jgi:hypothetical protein
MFAIDGLVESCFILISGAEVDIGCFLYELSFLEFCVVKTVHHQFQKSLICNK